MSGGPHLNGGRVCVMVMRMGSPRARPSPPMVLALGSPRAAGAWSYDDLWLCCPLRWVALVATRRWRELLPHCCCSLVCGSREANLRASRRTSPHAAGEPGWREG